MADRIFDIQWFSGGESDDLTRWPKDSFYQAENVEVRKDLSGVTLTSKLVDTWWSISGDIIFMENLEKYGFSWVVVATDTGNVYLNWTLKQTLATGTSAHNRIIWMGTMKVSSTQYFYFITKSSTGAGKIHRSTTNLTTWDVSYKNYDTVNGTASDSAFSLSINGEVLFAINNCIVGIDSVETVTNRLELPEIEYCVWFTHFQNNYKIYTNFGTTGVQYMWDWFDTAPDYRQEWENQNILAVTNNGAFDYAILGAYGTEGYNDLYIISGSQKQELRVNLETSSTARVFNRYISIREDIVYISWGKTGESSNYGIYTYGNYYPWTAKSLVQSYSGTTTSFIFHAHWLATSYFACNDDKVYQVEHNNPPTTLGYASSWYVVSTVYEGQVWEELKFNKIILGYKLPNGTQIKLYIRKDTWDSWNLVKTLTYATDWDKKGYILHANEMKSLWFGNFYSFQIKAELIPDNTYAYSPILKRITAFLTPITNV